MFPHLPFAIWLSLMLVGPGDTGWCLYLLCACKPILETLGDLLSPGTDWCGAAEFLGAGVVLVGCVPSDPLLCRSLLTRLLHSHRHKDGGILPL